LPAPVPADKPVAVEKPEEQMEVLLSAVVGRYGQEQKMPRHPRKQHTQVVPFGTLFFIAEDRGGHLVGLVADD
jgi:hypothetical protein